MQATLTALAGVVVLEPAVFGDARGFFFESFNQRLFEQAIGRAVTFVQDNQSRSGQGVIRGLHYQIPPKAQGKLVRVVAGEVFDVAVDLRRGSPTLGQWVGVILSAENKKQLWIPEGFAHGFQVLSESADVLYKTAGYWSRDHERAIRWNDTTLGIAWPGSSSPIVSGKDAEAGAFTQAELF